MCKNSPQKGYTDYDTKLHLIMRLQFWRFKHCEVPPHCQYLPVHFVLEW